MKKNKQNIFIILISLFIVASTITNGFTSNAQTVLDPQDISITIPNADNLRFRTYTDSNSGLIDDLTIPIDIRINKNDISGVTLEIPYSGSMPSLNDAIYNDFSIRENIFTFITPDASTGSPIVDNYENDIINNKIIVHLKPTKVGTETINLNFEFNQNYNSRIPDNQIIWKDLQVIIKDESKNIVSETNKYNIKTTAIDGISVGFDLLSPNGKEVTGNTVSFRAVYENNYNEHLLLDEAHTNQMYVEMPKELSIDFSNDSGLFNSTSKTETNGLVRYYVNFKDTSEFFPYWKVNGDANINFNRTEFLVKGFDTLPYGQPIEIKIGMDYKKQNVQSKVKEVKISYTKNQNKLDTKVQVRGNSADKWIDTDYFGVNKDDTLETRISMKNSGKNSFHKMRIYNILPSEFDGRGSSANIKLNNVNTIGSVYYTTKPISELPTYESQEAKLQNWTIETLNKFGFSKTMPSNKSSITAIYIDFENEKIAPNQEVDTILSFLISNDNYQLLINKYVYSASVVEETNLSFTGISDDLIFSSEVGQILYKEKKPNTTSEIILMPSPLLEIVHLDNDKKGEHAISKSKPFLKGYTFLYWKDSFDQTKYQPNEIIKFDKNISPRLHITLESIWQPNTYMVSFDSNNGVGTMNDIFITYDTSTSLTKSTFTKEGYTFKGWSNKPNGSVVYQDEERVTNLAINNGDEVILYAVWEKNEDSIDLNIENTTLYVRQGTSINSKWIINNIKPSTNIKEVSYNIVGNMNTDIVGTLPLKIEVSHNGKTVSKSFSIIVKPKMSLKNNNISLKLSELSKDTIIRKTIPAAWDTSNPLNAITVKTFSVETIPNTSGTHKVIIKASNQETAEINLTITNDVVTKRVNDISAENININIKDLENADIISLSKAKGIQRLYNSEGKLLGEIVSKVKVGSRLPSAVGEYRIRLVFEDVTKSIILSVYADEIIEKEIADEEISNDVNYIIEANDIVMSRSKLKSMNEVDLKKYVLKMSNARLINLSTKENYGSTRINIRFVDAKKYSKIDKENSLVNSGFVDKIGYQVKQKIRYKDTSLEIQKDSIVPMLTVPQNKTKYFVLIGAIVLFGTILVFRNTKKNCN